MSDEQYKEFCKEVRKVYKAVMLGKNKVMAREDFQKNSKLYYIKLISDEKEKLILLSLRRAKIYKKVGMFMYYHLRGQKPNEIKVVKFEKPIKAKKFIKGKKFVKGKKNGQKSFERNYKGNRKSINIKKQ